MLGEKRERGLLQPLSSVVRPPGASVSAAVGPTSPREQSLISTFIFNHFATKHYYSPSYPLHFQKLRYYPPGVGGGGRTQSSLDQWLNPPFSSHPLYHPRLRTPAPLSPLHSALHFLEDHQASCNPRLRGCVFFFLEAEKAQRRFFNGPRFSNLHWSNGSILHFVPSTDQPIRLSTLFPHSAI